MSFPQGSRLGPYEIMGAIGKGGMGEVFRARDTTLGREAAIKVLPAAVATDPERLARFKREAQVLASLNHVNIAHVYGFEGATLQDGTTAHFLAMELVEGDDLSERLLNGAVPLDEAMALAHQIAEGLEEAHDRGIIHRDLKPANIKVTPDGKVKILDFGLAKALEGEAAASASGSQLANSPTLSRHMTEAGMILGTAAYMSPEQARGKALDKRTDIWAFGVVFFEMITGKRLFAGETISDVLAAVLTRDPDWTTLPANTPFALKQLLKRCLERNPKNRLHDIADARLALTDEAVGDKDRSGTVMSASRSSWFQRALPWTIAMTSILVAAMAWSSNRGAAATNATVRFDLPWPGGLGGNASDSFEVSPDGRSLAIVAENQLWVRSLDTVAARPVTGSEGATYPFWSPDGASLAFFAGGELRRVGRDGGSAQKLCDAPNPRGGSWGLGGTIIFSDGLGLEGLSRIEDRGGKPSPLNKVAAPGTSHHRYPKFLPDGRHFLFTYLTGSKDAAGVYVGDLEGTPPVRVLEGSDHAAFALAPHSSSSGHLVFRRLNVLMAAPFDLKTLRVVGEMFPVAERVGLAGNTGHGAFSVSSTGMLVHSELSLERDVLTWLDRTGRSLKAVSARLSIDTFEMSPDGRTIAFAAGDPTGRTDIWLQPAQGGSPSRFTFGQGPGWAFPIWSADSTHLLYATQNLVGQAGYEIHRRRVDRGGAEDSLISDVGELDPWAVSPDGSHVVYSRTRDSTLWRLPLTGGGEPTEVKGAAAPTCCVQFSPNGRFLVFASGLPETSQVFVQPAGAEGGALWQVSTQGGSLPRWRADGHEIFYRANDGRLMAVAVRSDSDGLGFGTPAALFGGVRDSGSAGVYTYQSSSDGQRFLVAQVDEGGRSPITVVLNWQNAVGR